MRKQKKPKVGDLYKIFLKDGLNLNNILEIIAVYDGEVDYKVLNDDHIQVWNYVKHPEILDQKLTKLEKELL